MNLVLVTGGARAGKSRWAEEEARSLAGDAVTFVATAQALDDEMAARIAAHRRARPLAWETVEEPLALGRAVLGAPTPVVIVDCLTLWCSNVLLSPGGGAPEVARGTSELIEAATARDGHLIIVTNEVGLGVVPEHHLARTYRDALGEANAALARAAARVVLVVAGIPIDLKGRNSDSSAVGDGTPPGWGM